MTTGSAADITKSSAQLKATVNARGLPTESWFEYGTISGSYNSATDKQNLTNINIDTSLSADIKGLIAENLLLLGRCQRSSEGTVYGQEVFFTTTNQDNPNLKAHYDFEEVPAALPMMSQATAITEAFIPRAGPPPSR